MITDLHLENFTTFNDLKINFSPKINVIIGENGTGKTILLKAIYALGSICEAVKTESISEVKDGKNIISSILNQLYRPLNEKVENLKTFDDAPAEIMANYWPEENIAISVGSYFSASDFRHWSVNR